MFFTSSNVATEYNKKPKVLYVSWAENCSRSDHTARELGGASHMIYIPQLGSHPATIILKYFGQFFMTLAAVSRKARSGVRHVATGHRSAAGLSVCVAEAHTLCDRFAHGGFSDAPLEALSGLATLARAACCHHDRSQ